MRLPNSASSKASGSSFSKRSHDKPIIIKPPAMVRQSNSKRRPAPRPHESPPPTFSQRLARSIKEKKGLRNSNTRNPEEASEGKSLLGYKDSNRKDIFRASDSQDEDFYKSLRQDVLEASSVTKMSPSRSLNAMHEWKNKVAYLEENLKDQNQAMEIVMKQNEELESKLAKANQQREKRDQFSLEIPGAPSMHYPNRAAELEMKMLRLNQSGHAAGDAAGQLAIAERNRMMRKEKQLEESLAIAQEKNERLQQELNSKTIEMGERSYNEREAQRKEAERLETSLAVAQTENRALLEEIRRHSLEFEKLERIREQQGSEIRTLRSELDTNRRIVHTKRNLIRKEMTDEALEQLRNDMEDQLKIDITSRVTEELEIRFREEKDTEIREIREDSEERVRNIECQIPILEDTIDHLRKELSLSKASYERNIASMEAKHQDKLERMVENFSEDRKREERDSNKRIETLLHEIEQNKERAAAEKEECIAKVREEVKDEMQKEVQFLANRVTELTTELIEVVESMKQEKNSFGDEIRDQLTEEKEKAVAEAMEENELQLEKLRQKMTEERAEEVSKIKTELEQVIMERELLLESIESENTETKRSNKVKNELGYCKEKLKECENERDLLRKELEEVGTDLRLTKEKYEKDADEFDKSKLESESLRTENKKLRNQREELIIMAEDFKNDCINMSSEMKKIKSHFKFAVLVEYEEKIIELENELQRLEALIAESNAVSSEDIKKISQQSLQLEQHKAKEQDLEHEIKRLKDSLMSSVSELELKEVRLTELKELIQKKEIEAFKSNESAKELQRQLDATEDKLAKARDEKEHTMQKMVSTEVYRQKIAALNKELTKQKSKLEHCRCECNGEVQSSATQEDFKNLEERTQRLKTMLKVAEKNQQRERLDFEAVKDELETNLLASTDEIRGLELEVSRLKELLDRSRSQIQNAESQQSIEHLQQNETLKTIEANFETFRSASEDTIQKLKDELRVENEQKMKVAQKLEKSQLLFREAAMAWRVERTSLTTQLDYARHSELANSVYPRDGDSELSDDSPESNNYDFESIKEQQNESTRDRRSMPHSVEISVIETSATPQHQATHSNIRDDIEEARDESSSNPTTNCKTEAPEKKFTKMLDISEHTNSIEMRFDHENREQSVDEQSRDELSEGELSEGERMERDNAEAIYKSLQDFKKEYKKYVGEDNFTDIAENSFIGRKVPSVLGAGSKISKLAHAPQPQLDSNTNDEQDQTNLDRSTSKSTSRRSFLSQQNRLFSTEIDESNSKDVSERTSASERSRALRKKMSDLLEIKNNIRVRPSAQVPADTQSNGEVAKSQPPQNESFVTKTNPKSEAPWGLAADKNPKLYKFLKSKSSSSEEEEVKVGESSKPFDESSKHTLRGSVTAEPTTNDAFPTHE